MNNLEEHDLSSRFLVTEVTDLDGDSSKEVQGDDKVDHGGDMSFISISSY